VVTGPTRPNNVRLRQLNESSLEDLLEVAVTDAEPDETMPPMPGHPGWSPERRAGFREFFRPMLAGLTGPKRTIIYAIIVDDRIAGFIRLARTDREGVAETGMWLGRSWRGRGIASQSLRLLVAEAAGHGFTKLAADTSPENAPALGALRALGAQLWVYAELAIDPA
jgi:RimJ/RimL family protein N-acetyltransferase